MPVHVKERILDSLKTKPSDPPYEFQSPFVKSMPVGILQTKKRLPLPRKLTVEQIMNVTGYAKSTVEKELKALRKEYKVFSLRERDFDFDKKSWTDPPVVWQLTGNHIIVDNGVTHEPGGSTYGKAFTDAIDDLQVWLDGKIEHNDVPQHQNPTIDTLVQKIANDDMWEEIVPKTVSPPPSPEEELIKALREVINPKVVDKGVSAVQKYRDQRDSVKAYLAEVTKKAKVLLKT